MFSHAYGIIKTGCILGQKTTRSNFFLRQGLSHVPTLHSLGMPRLVLLWPALCGGGITGLRRDAQHLWCWALYPGPPYAG